MFTIFRNSDRYCDSVSRRSFLRVGGLAMGGLTLPRLLPAEAEAGAAARGKSVINIYLGGGPTHMDTFDLKPQAPVEFRGELNPISTNVPGIQISEYLPKLATMADDYAIVRSLTGVNNEHSPSQSDSGWPQKSLPSVGGHPGLGAVVSKMFGSMSGTVPTSMSLSGGFGKAGFLGAIHRPYDPGAMRSNLRLNGNMTLDRLGDRQALLGELDRVRREADNRGAMTAMDAFTERAVGVVTSSKLADALEINKEDPAIFEKYGYDRSKNRYRENNRFLLARRLIEVGVRCVSFSWGGWDTHRNNFESMREQLPALDAGLSGLIADLKSRGMLDDVIIMMSGEFGRTPRLNSNGGRGHGPEASFCVLAGGGLSRGQGIGATNRLGEHAQDRPVHLQQVFATVYHQIGIDPETTTLIDPNGRPQYLVQHRDPIHALI